MKATLRSSDMSKRSEARPKLFKIKIFFIQYFQVGYIKQQILKSMDFNFEYTYYKHKNIVTYIHIIST